MIKLSRAVYSTQTLQIIRLPDIPGWVVRVHRVTHFVSSFSAAAAVSAVLNHNVNLGETLSINDFGSAWCRIDQAITAEVPPGVQVYDPEPYELIGPQRWISIASAGNVISVLSIIYSMRRERNKVLWNALRAKTSFERG